MRLNKVHTSFGKKGEKDKLKEVAIGTRLDPNSPYFGKSHDVNDENGDDEGGEKKRAADSKKVTPSHEQDDSNWKETRPEDL